jgi:hypothetical protein
MRTIQEKKEEFAKMEFGNLDFPSQRVEKE